VDVLFHQAGVIRADTLEEMFDVAALLAHQPLPRGRRVAVVSNSGGVLTICVDACEARGLVTASPGVIDVGPFATVEAYESAVQTAMEQDEIDALIAIYACVGNCDPDVVGRGIRRGVLRAERTTGTPKPALLCLMGAQRAVRLGADGASELESRHVFPSYRFPESAARALSRAVQYADFRAQPAGRVLWYEDVDAAAARQEVRTLVSHEADEVVWLEGERATGVLRSFGVRTVTAADVVCSLGTGDATLEVRSDPSFGPLLCLLRAGRDPVVRITPLTDRDIRDVLQAAGLPADHGVEELLGRVSQMIEELPWLCGMTARIHGLVDQSGPTGALLGAGVRMGICRHDAGLL
jgi:acyl-CoA synthetase (NDP forming)